MLFDTDFLQKLEYLSLVCRRALGGSLLAQRRTQQSGGGIEFADHRQYTHGDDYRYLNWNVYARHGELLLKRFHEEADLHVYLLLDCSQSMEFGQPPKFDFARQIAAALAYMALADMDRVAVLAFSDEIVAEFPLTRGKSRILALLGFLEGLKPQGAGTDLARVASAFVHRVQRRGLAVVISDLFDPDGYERGMDLLRHHRYEPHVVQLYDRREANPELRGDVELFDVESQATRKVTITEGNLNRYRKLFQDFTSTVQCYCNKYGMHCTQTTTDVPLDELVLRMMSSTGAVA